MDFTFSAEQDALRAAVRRWLAEHPVRADDPAAVDWAPFEELFGGVGLMELVVIAEEIGRVPYPGPFASSTMAAIACRHLGLSLDGRGTVAIEEAGGGDPVARVRTRAVRKAGRWRLTGEKPVVLDGDTAAWALVVARSEHGVGTFLLDAPAGEVVPAWDVTRVVTRLELAGREATPVGPDGDQAAIWRRIVDDVNVVTCAELVGSMESALDLAVEYAKVRVQFDRPIATFQAIKHKLAEMLHRVTLARVGTHYAAWASEADDPVREEAAAMAKAYVAEAANEVAGESIQIHGGVGFTWDCQAHLHYRKAKQADLLLGYQGFQRQRLADLVIG